jgi:hypothetical protein
MISEEVSMKSDTRPSATTLRGTARMAGTCGATWTSSSTDMISLSGVSVACRPNHDRSSKQDVNARLEPIFLQSVKPPSITWIAPVVNADSSEAR